MSGILTPVANNYTLGKGLLFFDQFIAGTQTTQGEDFLGDCKGATISVKTTQVDHYQSTGGVKTLDQSAAIQVDSSGQLMTENCSGANLSRFFFGASTTVSQTAATVAAEPLPPVIPGLYYQLGKTVSNPMGTQNIDPATPILVKDTTATTTYVLGTDYAFDYVSGRIQILPGGAITSGSQPKVTYSTLAKTKNRVASGVTPIEGAVRFVPANVTGTQRGAYLPWVKLIPNGSYELIGDKFIDMTFDLKVLSLAGAPFISFQEM